MSATLSLVLALACHHETPPPGEGTIDECVPIDELCDGEDQDCDGKIDEGVTSSWYADGDEDGFGDPDDDTVACDAPQGSVEDSSDCDDDDPDIHPGAEELCDAVDQDCDTEVDEDALDLELWYADEDSDGYGDSAVVEEACDAPEGMVGNADDCDDTNGRLNCVDSDGDGVQDDWDADPADPSVVMGPVLGTGAHGAFAPITDATLPAGVLLVGGAEAGDEQILVAKSTNFEVGDEILILSQLGDDAGTHATHYVVAMETGVLHVVPPLEIGYSSTSTVWVQPIRHYTDVDVPSGVVLTAEGWGGSGGGVAMFRATGRVGIAGTVTVSELGYRSGVVGGEGPEGGWGRVTSGGGNGGNGGGYDGCNTGTGAQAGGGAGGNGGDHYGSYGHGGGGGYGTGGGGGGGGTSDGHGGDDGGAGGTGTGAAGASSSGYGGGGGGGGQAYDGVENPTHEDASRIFMGGGASAGAGGGGGSHAGFGNGAYGGAADGLAGVTSDGWCDGTDGTDGTSGTDGGSGGGLVWITADTLEVTGAIRSWGASGGAGGSGGDGTTWYNDSKTECSGGGGGGGGGNGGAGGTILLAASEMDVGENLVVATGGSGGIGGAGGGIGADCDGFGYGGAGVDGADGAPGIVFVWADTLVGTSDPRVIEVGAFGDLPLGP